MGAYTRKNKAEIAEDFERAYTLFPRLKEREKQLAGDDVGWRTADARHRARSDEPSTTVAARRAVHGVGAADHSADLPDHRRDQLSRDDGAWSNRTPPVRWSKSHRAYVLETGTVTRSGTGRDLLADLAIKEAYLARSTAPSPLCLFCIPMSTDSAATSDAGALPDRGAVGAYIRQQRELASVSLRELSRMSKVSNAYLSQLERGLHEPSLRVMKAVADALSLEDLLARTQDSSDTPSKPRPDVEVAIRAEDRLSPAQQEVSLIAVYRQVPSRGLGGLADDVACKS